MRLFLLLPLFLAAFSPLFAQITFKKLYGTAAADEARFVEVLPDGSFIVAGSAGQDALLVKFSADGTVQWSKTFGGAGVDVFTRLLSCSDGNFIALGETTSFGAGNVDIYIVKFNTAGNLIWQRTAGGTSEETARGIIEVSDGYVISGGTRSFGAGFWDIFVEKIDFVGNSQWSKAWGGGGGDIAGEVLPGTNNEIWVSGFYFVASNNHDANLLRLAPNGDLLEAARYTLPGNDGFGSVDFGGAGLVAGGGTWVGNAHQPLLMSFNNNGTLNWAKRYPVPGGNYDAHVEACPDGGVVFAPYNISNNTQNATLVKTNSNGDVSWSKSFTFEGFGRMRHARPTPDGGYVAVGFAIANGQDMFILKTDANGEVELCCPDDGGVTAVTLNPGTVVFTPSTANGPAAASASGPNQDTGISMTDICTAGNCCSPPIVVIAPPPPLTCDNPTVTLNASGSSSGNYQWTGPGIVSGATTLQPVVDQPGLYTLEITDANTGCAASASVLVSDQTQLPAAVAIASAPVTCFNPSVPISGAGSSTGPGIVYQWTTTNGNIVSGATTLTPTVNQGGTYTLTVTNTATGCVNTAIVTVVQNTVPPVAAAGSNVQLDCGQPSAQLNGAGSSTGPGFTYQWTPAVAGGGNTLTPTVNQPGTYTLTVTNTVNGCTASSQALVTQDFTPPTVQAAAPGSISCANPQIELSGAGSSEGPNFSYLWTTTNGQIISGANTLTPIVGAPGAYLLTVTNTQNSCVFAAGVQVAGNTNAPVADAGPGGEITCGQTQLTLQGSIAGAPDNLVFSWTANPGNIASGANTLTPVVNAGGWYTLTVTDTLNACFDTASVEIVQEDNIPLIIIAEPGLITCDQPAVTLDGTGSSQGPDLIFAWTTQDGAFAGGEETLSPSVESPGVYILTITDTLSGCAASLETEVFADLAPPSLSAEAPDLLNCYEPEITLSADAGGLTEITIIWTTSDGNIVSGADTLTPTVDQPGIYTLEAINLENGCAATLELEVEADFAPPQVNAGPWGLITCANGLDTLTGWADGGGAPLAFSWSTIGGSILFGANTLEVVVNDGGSYFLQATNLENGCQASATTFVGVDLDFPIADAGQDALLNCYTPTLELDGGGSSAGGPFSYSWSTNDGNIVEGENTLNPLVDQPGTYLLIVLNTVNQCATGASVTIGADFETPVADAGEEVNLTCAEPEVLLNGSGSQGPAFAYSWAGPGIISGGNTLSSLVGIAGVYTLTVLNEENGCTAADEAMVTGGSDLPEAVAVAAAMLTCANPEVQLDGLGSSGGPDFAYHWTTGNGLILSGANTLTPVVGAPGAYFLEVLNLENGCAATAHVLVEEDIEVPVAVVSAPDGLTCVVTELQLSAAGSSQGPEYQYQWSATDGNILSGENTLTPVVNEPGEYNLLIINAANGCSATAIALVMQNTTPPSANAGTAQQLTCTTISLALNGAASSASGALLIEWTTLDGNILSGANTLTPQIDAPGLYELLVTDPENGCTALAQVTVTQDVEAPTLSIANPGMLTCIQTQVELNATGSDAGPGFDILWTTPGGQILSGANTLSPLIGAAGQYFLSITNTLNGCASSGSATVAQDIVPPFVEAGGDFTIPCTDDQATLSGAASPGGQLQWTTADGELLSGANTLTPAIGGGGTYLLTALNPANGCEASDEVLVSENYPEGIAFEAANPLCQGETGQIEIQGPTGGTPPYVYSIDGGASFQSGPLFANLAAGGYAIVAQDALGCETETLSHFMPEPLPVVVNVAAQIQVSLGESQQLQVFTNLAPGEIQTIVWTPALGLSCADCLRPVASPLDNTTYTVEIWNQNGCYGTASVQFVVDRRPAIFVPNVFSPNADGQNDVFFINARPGSVAQIRSFMVFDRWGESVCAYQNFQPNDPAHGWDGTHRGRALDPGVFVWYAEIEFIDGRVEMLKGDVALIR